MSNNTPLSSVPVLDLERYLGTWFEIGRLPLKWEDDNATNVTATYSLNEDGTVKVDNRCFDNNNEPTQSLGVAKPVPDQPGQLTVSFLPKYLRWIPFTEGDYWVLKIDEAYEHSLVGAPNMENLWLLSRTPHIEPGVREEYLAEATRQGFDLSAWITPVHDGRVVSDQLLEEES